MEQHIDLSLLHNTCFIEPAKGGKGEAGFGMAYFSEEELPFSCPLQGEQCTYVLTRGPGGMDGVNCQGQRLPLSGVKAEKLCFLGFCNWGDYSARLRVDFAGGGSEYVLFGFSDMCWELPAGTAENMFELEGIIFRPNCQTVKQKTKKGAAARHMVFECIAPLQSKGEDICAITFPDNFFMNVFALTLLCG